MIGIVLENAERLIGWDMASSPFIINGTGRGVPVKPPAPARTEASYLEECGTFCPYCAAAILIRRDFAAAQLRRLEGGTLRVVVPCHCGLCAGSWSEDYALESAAIPAGRGGGA